MADLGRALGLVILHSSQCQPKNTTSIIVANLLSLAFGTIAFWICGFAFAFGYAKNTGNGFISHEGFLLSHASQEDSNKFFAELLSLYFALVICNSGFICRLRYWVYPILALLIAGFTYPIVRHWTWHKKGWLYSGIDTDQGRVNYGEYFGAGSIHVFGGVVSLCGTISLAPRKDRNSKNFKPIGGIVTPLLFVGGILTFTGIFTKGPPTPANYLLSAQASAIVSYGAKKCAPLGDTSPTKALVNGAFAGLVAMTCEGNAFYPYGAFIVGVIAGFVFVAWTALLQKIHVDDPTDSVAIHLGCGLLAMLISPLFFVHHGVFYSGTKLSFKTFGWHLLGAFTICLWAGVTTIIPMIVLRVVRIALYTDESVYEKGLDVYEHSEPAYPNKIHHTHDESMSPFIADMNMDIVEIQQNHA